MTIRTDSVRCVGVTLQGGEEEEEDGEIDCGKKQNNYGETVSKSGSVSSKNEVASSQASKAYR